MTIIKIADDSPAAMKVLPSSFRYFVPGNCGGPLLETEGVLLNPVEPSSLTFWLDCVSGNDKKNQKSEKISIFRGASLCLKFMSHCMMHLHLILEVNFKLSKCISYFNRPDKDFLISREEFMS